MVEQEAELRLRVDVILQSNRCTPENAAPAMEDAVPGLDDACPTPDFTDSVRNSRGQEIGGVWHGT